MKKFKEGKSIQQTFRPPRPKKQQYYDYSKNAWDKMMEKS